MTTTDKIPILGSKAVIFKNKYDVWQFRMYVKNARRYVEKSLRTKERALAEERAEDLYIEIRNDMKLGKSFFAITIKEGVALYLEYRKQDVGIADIGIVEGSVRRQGFWHQWGLKLRESLAHLVDCIMRRVVCDASAAFRVYSV